MNVIFDLDGTLVDSSERLFRLFQELVPESQFTKKQYWDLKRNKVNHKMILENYFPKYDFYDFNQKWLDRIELEEYLNMDLVYPDTIPVLDVLRKKYNIVLLTARQSREKLLHELDRLEISFFFNRIYVTEAKTTKKDLLINSDVMIGKDDFFISDMGKDIIEGKELGIQTVGITHGFMNEEKMKEYSPQFLISNLSQLLKIIE